MTFSRSIRMGQKLKCYVGAELGAGTGHHFRGGPGSHPLNE